MRSRLYDDGKKLTAFLRHTAPVDVNGYIAVEELLRFRRFEGWTSVRVREAVAASNKNRFNLRTSQGVEQVAAWSGHTIRGVLGPAQHVEAGSLPGVLVHGTYSSYVPSIQAEGLVPTRRSIHLLDPKHPHRKWRPDLEVAILIDACKAQAENHVSFRLTGNGIYLADHALPSELFLAILPWSEFEASLAPGSGFDWAEHAGGGSTSPVVTSAPGFPQQRAAGPPPQRPAGPASFPPARDPTRSSFPPARDPTKSSFPPARSSAPSHSQPVVLTPAPAQASEEPSSGSRDPAPLPEEAMVTTDHETAAEAIEVSEDEAGLPLNAETATPGPVESLAAVAKALDPVTASQGTTTVFVKLATFEVLQSAGDDEPDWSADEEEPVIVQAIPAGEDQTEAGHREDEASPRRVSRPELASSSSARAASVSRAGEAGELTSRTATRTRSESPKVRFGTAHLQLIREIAQADSANFKSLKKVVEGSNVSALTKSQTLDRLEQLAYQRGVASLEGKIRAIDVQRDVAQRARTEAAYLESLTPEMRALEQNNSVRPSAGASKTSDARMQQAIAAGGSVWVERRKQKGRERAARHREAQAAQAAEERAAVTSVIADLPVDQRGPALDAEMDRRAREELTEFRRMLREEARAARPHDPKPRQKDSKRRAALKWQRWRQRRSTDDMDRDTNHAIAHLADRGEEGPAPAARFAPGEDPVDCAMHRGDGDTRSCPSAAGRGDGHFGRCADAAGLREAWDPWGAPSSWTATRCSLLSSRPLIRAVATWGRLLILQSLLLGVEAQGRSGAVARFVPGYEEAYYTCLCIVLCILAGLSTWGVATI
ncbi:unnamed protein product [Symbiodinium sp. CCMP2592]|nr:unnamed protein product [Symbiodinium sp. CCMP2592]